MKISGSSWRRVQDAVRDSERNRGRNIPTPTAGVNGWALRWAVVTGAESGGLYPALLTYKSAGIWYTEAEIRLEPPNGETLSLGLRYLCAPSTDLSGEYSVWNPVATCCVADVGDGIVCGACEGLPRVVPVTLDGYGGRTTGTAIHNAITGKWEFSFSGLLWSCYGRVDCSSSTISLRELSIRYAYEFIRMALSGYEDYPSWAAYVENYGLTHSEDGSFPNFTLGAVLYGHGDAVADDAVCETPCYSWDLPPASAPLDDSNDLELADNPFAVATAAKFYFGDCAPADPTTTSDEELVFCLTLPEPEPGCPILAAGKHTLAHYSGGYLWSSTVANLVLTQLPAAYLNVHNAANYFCESFDTTPGADNVFTLVVLPGVMASACYNNLPPTLVVHVGDCPEVPDPDPEPCEHEDEFCVVVDMADPDDFIGNYTLTDGGNEDGIWGGPNSCGGTGAADMDLSSDPKVLRFVGVGPPGNVSQVYTCDAENWSCETGGTFTRVGGDTDWPATLDVLPAGTCEEVVCPVTGPDCHEVQFCASVDLGGVVEITLTEVGSTGVFTGSGGGIGVELDTTVDPVFALVTSGGNEAIYQLEGFSCVSGGTLAFIDSDGGPSWPLTIPIAPGDCEV